MSSSPATVVCVKPPPWRVGIHVWGSVLIPGDISTTRDRAEQGDRARQGIRRKKRKGPRNKGPRHGRENCDHSLLLFLNTLTWAQDLLATAVRLPDMS